MTVAAAEQDATARFFCEELEEDLTARIQESEAVGGDAAEDAKAEADSSEAPLSAETQRTVRSISDNVVGARTLFDSPFGPRALSYADFTASGKSLECVEHYIQREVLPLYGNTHTTTSITGLQTTCFRHEARQIVAQAVNAKITGRGAEDCVLFTGQGSTSAVNKLVSALGLQQLCSANRSVPSQRPVVFVGPFEHHSNLLPWRESGAEVVSIPEDALGRMDLTALQSQLELYAQRPLKIGAFSAASNITGLLADVDGVSALLHQHGALVCWDYASCAPYVAMDMNPVVADETRRAFVYKDAIFFSGHKFIGGPGSPGVLVVKKRLLSNAVPTAPGGGTVFFVTEKDHRYLSNRAEREEGGTPDILGSIRLGLAFELKQRVGAANILKLEKRHVRRVRESLAGNDHVVLLGRHSRDDAEQLPVFSFLVRLGDRFLHYNFVCALLNDLFGVQTRGGCQCAGPYATRLLGLARRDVLALESALMDKKELLRPGFTRMSFPYFMADAELEYVLQAVDFVATHGWKFLPQYRFNHKSGVWKHASRFTKFPDRKWLSHFGTTLEAKSRSRSLGDDAEELAAHRTENLAAARRLADQLSAKSTTAASVVASATQMLEQADDEALRWFVYPSEVAEAVKRGEKPALQDSLRGPFQPARYLSGELQHQWEDATGSSQSAASVCALGTCGAVPETATVPTEQQTPVASEAAGRETGGKYPLRSVATGAQEQAPRQPSKANKTPCSTGRCPTSASSSVQEVTTAMSHKTAATKLFPTPPKKLMRWVGQALMQWDMIQDGDRLLLGVSGGKDSLSLLHVLLSFQKRAPVRFELACATVDPQTASFDPSPLKEYMRALGVPYYYLSENIIERATCELSGDSLCSYCSRMKRGLLYTCCRTRGFNKLVLAQHLDDLAESFFMSAMHNGQLRTMKAKYWNDQRDVQVLRPLAYVRELELKKFAYDARLPVINENCPACFEEPKERHRVKKMLAQEESLYPEMYNSLRRALLPLMDDHSYAPLEAVRTRIEQAKQERKHAPSSKSRTGKTKVEPTADAKAETRLEPVV